MKALLRDSDTIVNIVIVACLASVVIVPASFVMGISPFYYIIGSGLGIYALGRMMSWNMDGNTDKVLASEAIDMYIAFSVIEGGAIAIGIALAALAR